MPFIKITRATFLSGEPAAVGDTFEVDEHTAAQTVACNKGVIVESPAPVEPPKPKVKKVESEKPKAE